MKRVRVSFKSDDEYSNIRYQAFEGLCLYLKKGRSDEPEQISPCLTGKLNRNQDSFSSNFLRLGNFCLFYEHFYLEIILLHLVKVDTIAKL